MTYVLMYIFTNQVPTHQPARRRRTSSLSRFTSSQRHTTIELTCIFGLHSASWSRGNMPLCGGLTNCLPELKFMLAILNILCRVLPCLLWYCVLARSQLLALLDVCVALGADWSRKQNIGTNTSRLTHHLLLNGRQINAEVQRTEKTEA